MIPLITHHVRQARIQNVFSLRLTFETNMHRLGLAISSHGVRSRALALFPLSTSFSFLSECLFVTALLSAVTVILSFGRKRRIFALCTLLRQNPFPRTSTLSVRLAGQFFSSANQVSCVPAVVLAQAHVAGTICDTALILQLHVWEARALNSARAMLTSTSRH